MTGSSTAPAAPGQMYQTHNDLPMASREPVIALLNEHLATLLDLYSQTKYTHWNVKGINFYQLHLLFDTLADQLIESIDTVAERHPQAGTRALGGTALGTVRIGAARSALPEYPFDAVDGAAHIEALAERYGHYAAAARAAIAIANERGDIGTADLFTDVSRAMDKHLWFLEVHLQAYRVNLEPTT